MEKRAGDLNNDLEKTSTKQRILDSATDLFAMKGYTETTIRELAAVVGVKEASIYNHFPSKKAILECILEEYSQFTNSFFDRRDLSMLRDNPTADDILSCMMLSFPDGKAEYYLKKLCVVLQEQHRNPIVRKFVSEQLILSTEQVSRMVIDKLKEFHILRPDTNPDFWAKMHSSLVYAFDSRLSLGIGDSSPGFSGLGLAELLRGLYDMMLKTCKIGPHAF